MRFSEIILNEKYPGLNPRAFGYETCQPSHAFGPAVRTHWLLHYVESGFGKFTREGVTYDVRPGDIFVIPPYLETFYKADETRPWSYVWIGFSVKDAELQEVFGQPVISCPEAGEIFNAMRLCHQYEKGRSAYLAGCLWKLVSLLQEQGKQKPDYIDMALACIHAEFATGITVQQIADRLSLDRSYFSTVFTARMGIPPRDYLRNYRMNKAAELMTVHGERPSTAALSVGYEDLFHFSKAFKQHFGLAPREYIKQYKEKK